MVLAQAWHTENFRRAGKKLKPLSKYLDATKPKRAQTAEEVLAVFEALAARGAGVTIRQRD